MSTPAKVDSILPSPSRLNGEPIDTDGEEREFLREIAKLSRRTTAKEIDRLFGRIE